MKTRGAMIVAAAVCGLCALCAGNSFVTAAPSTGAALPARGAAAIRPAGARPSVAAPTWAFAYAAAAATLAAALRASRPAVSQGKRTARAAVVCQAAPVCAHATPAPRPVAIAEVTAEVDLLISEPVVVEPIALAPVFVVAVAPAPVVAAAVAVAPKAHTSPEPARFAGGNRSSRRQRTRSARTARAAHRSAGAKLAAQAVAAPAPMSYDASRVPIKVQQGLRIQAASNSRMARQVKGASAVGLVDDTVGLFSSNEIYMNRHSTSTKTHEREQLQMALRLGASA